MVCRECGAKMRLDDVDGFFNRTCDKYWVCDLCVTSCIEEIRNGVSVNQIWYTENDFPSLDEILG